jgi:hypothetical protein
MSAERTPLTARRGSVGDILLRLFGWSVLFLALPLAAMAALHPPNEYQAMWGKNWLDCDGPVQTYAMAIPSLLIYGAGLLINGLRWRRRINLLAAIGCLLVCIAVAANIPPAIAEEREQELGCREKLA